MTLAELKLAIDRASLDLGPSTPVELDIEPDPDQDLPEIRDICTYDWSNHPVFPDTPLVLLIRTSFPSGVTLTSQIKYHSYMPDLPSPKGVDARRKSSHDR